MITDIQAWSPIHGAVDPLDDLGSHQLDLLSFIYNREIVAISAVWIDAQAIQMDGSAACNVME
ncbi:MAG: hypothetical protein ABSF24_03495 [Candidatus Bathyarchaeia archaeon]|jgi:hypothetical protein